MLRGGCPEIELHNLRCRTEVGIHSITAILRATAPDRRGRTRVRRRETLQRVGQTMNVRARGFAMARTHRMARIALMGVGDGAQQLHPSMRNLKVIENPGVDYVGAMCAECQVASVRSRTYAPTRPSQFVHVGAPVRYAAHRSNK
jgi:hypothetical protein